MAIEIFYLGRLKNHFLRLQSSIFGQNSLFRHDIFQYLDKNDFFTFRQHGKSPEIHFLPFASTGKARKTIFCQNPAREKGRKSIAEDMLFVLSFLTLDAGIFLLLSIETRGLNPLLHKKTTEQF